MKRIQEPELMTSEEEIFYAAADYANSLRRLLELDLETIYPAHGPVIEDGPGKIQEFIEHRLGASDVAGIASDKAKKLPLLRRSHGSANRALDECRASGAPTQGNSSPALPGWADF